MVKPMSNPPKRALWNGKFAYVLMQIFESKHIFPLISVDAISILVDLTEKYYHCVKIGKR